MRTRAGILDPVRERSSRVERALKVHQSVRPRVLDDPVVGPFLFLLLLLEFSVPARLRCKRSKRETKLVAELGSEQKGVPHRE